MHRTLDAFDWDWPESLNRDQVRHLHTFSFLREAANVVFMGTVGLGNLPVDRVGGELLFQVHGSRYETASTVITTNRRYSEWAKTFADDVALTTAVLDRVLHHSETVVITGRSYRMKGRIQND